MTPFFFALLVPLASLWAAEPQMPIFELHTADSSTTSGPLEQVSTDWSVSLAGSKSIRVQGSEVITLRRAKALLPASPRQGHVLFANGDRIPGTPLRLRDERLHFRPQFRSQAGGTDAELILPLTALSVLWLAAPDGTEDTGVLLRRLGMERRRHDRVLLRNGDIVEGTLSALDEKYLRVEAQNSKQIQLERDKVSAVALSTELVRSLKPKGIYGRLVLANGCRLSVASVRTGERSVAAKTLFGDTVQIPVEELLALELRQGRAVYLSDLKPRRYEHMPYLDLGWPYVVDGSVAGHDLLLAGSTYDKGLGMHSASRITYELGGSYQWFEAMVGLDGQTGRQGSVRIQVLVDGKAQVAGGDSELSGQDKPRPVRVRVAGARELTLVVDFGRHGDVQDHVDWADARLIK